MADLIDRQAAIEAIEKIDPSVAWLDYAADVIKALPSVQPVQKKGKWVEVTNTNNTYVCSVCGRMLVNITDGKNKVTKNYPFCHCGADMRGEDE